MLGNRNNNQSTAPLLQSSLAHPLLHLEPTWHKILVGIRFFAMAATMGVTMGVTMGDGTTGAPAALLRGQGARPGCTARVHGCTAYGCTDRIGARLHGCTVEVHGCTAQIKITRTLLRCTGYWLYSVVSYLIIDLDRKSIDGYDGRQPNSDV